MKRLLKSMGARLSLLGLLLAAGHALTAQAVTAVPKLDLNQFTGTWYVIASLPNKRQKECVRDTFTQIALADKPNRFQLVNACRTKAGDMDANNANGKVQNKKIADGRLKATFLWPFYEKYWVLALAADQSWALVGSPNHKTLWVFSKATTMKPDVLAEIEAKAAAEGFPVAKLVMIPQSARKSVSTSTNH